MGRLDGKTAIITGTAGGLGFSTVELFAEEGANVVAADLKFDLLKERVQKITDIDGEILPLEMDVASEEDWKNVVEKTIEKFGQVDILVNNAAMQVQGQDILRTEIDDWNQVVNVNQTGVMLGMKTVIPQMQEQERGSIVNISSVGGLVGGAADNFNAAYSATKGAVRSLTKHAAQMHAPDNIRVNSVHPGAMRTEMLEDSMKDEETRELLKTRFPLPPHAVDPKNMAYGILYLASEEAAYVTGSELVIDGGFTSK
jgi:cyclopentanol dehydrogenase